MCATVVIVTTTCCFYFLCATVVIVITTCCFRFLCAVQLLFLLRVPRATVVVIITIFAESTRVVGGLFVYVF